MATPRKSKAKSQRRCYRIRVELHGITPAIWRQIWVEGQMSLIQLHHILQAAMGWSDSHLHEFTINGLAYATPHPEDDPNRPVIDERKVQLQDLLESGLEFEYQYDFGDNWRHAVRVENSKPLGEPYGAAHVEAGACACPPEDSGGPYTYQEFLDNLQANPKDRKVRSFLRWAGEDFNPEQFDRRAANSALLRMAWNRWGEK